MSDVNSSSPMLKQVLTALIAAAVGMGIGLLIGKWQGVNALTEAQAAHDAAATALQTQLEQSRAETDQIRKDLDREVNEGILLGARSSIFQALNELDNRNFGLAAEHVNAASESLSTINTQILGLDQAQMDDLIASLSAFGIKVSADIQSQRLELIELGARIEALSETVSQ